MLRFIAVLIPIVFILLKITSGKWLESSALSVAVGLMPEMLPVWVALWSGSPLQRCRACKDAGTVYRNVSGWMVCRIHVDPDSGYPYDPYTKASVYPEPCIRTSNIAYHDRYCSSDSNSIYTIWSCAWSCSITGIILCISDSMYSAVYDAGDKLEKSICPLLWRTALGGGKNELERIMDDTFWNLWLARTQYGILGIYGCCAVDRNTHECSILGNKAKE